MTIVHVANTDAEIEYANASLRTLEESWRKHPLCLQLQFLPLLYANPDESIAVTDYPEEEYLHSLLKTGWWPQGLPRFVLLKETAPFEGNECISWGLSLKVKAWAEVRKMAYLMPKDWETICLINSKAFSFRYSILPEACLIDSEEKLLQWFLKLEGDKVLKTCFGFSGNGNRVVQGSFPSLKILSFCQKEWLQGRSVIGEPWLDRTMDFSTQWLIHPNKAIEFIGFTRFETDSKGVYQGTLAGPETLLFSDDRSFLEQHRHAARKALEDIAGMGFFGFIGIDAFLYRDHKTKSICLNPIVEINGRQTMSLVALLLQQKISPEKIVRMEYKKNNLSFNSTSLLPQKLTLFEKKTVPFDRNLHLFMG
jgi:hypothetical protein